MKRVKWICMYICSEWMDRRMEARNSWQLVAGHGINMANLQRPGIVAPSMTYVFVPHANEPKFAKIQSWFSRLARTKTKTSSIARHSGPNRKPNRSRNRRRWCQCLGPEAQKEPLSVIRHRWLSRSCWLHNHFAFFFFDSYVAILLVIFQCWQLANICKNNEFELHDRWQDAQQPQLCFVGCLAEKIHY